MGIKLLSSRQADANSIRAIAVNYGDEPVGILLGVVLELLDPRPRETSPPVADQSVADPATVAEPICKRGKVDGLTEFQRDRLLRRHRRGETIGGLASRFAVSEATVKSVVRAAQ